MVTLDPVNLEALGNLSDLLLEEGQTARAIKVTQVLAKKDPNPDRRIAHILRIAHIYEGKEHDITSASRAYRLALESSPCDINVIKESVDFFARHNDQRSLVVLLDGSIRAMRGLLEKEPYSSYPYQALYRLFGWRRTTDAQFCAAQVLEAFGAADAEAQILVKDRQHEEQRAGRQLADPCHDKHLLDRSVPEAFRVIFGNLSKGLGKIFGGDLRRHGVNRSERISNNSNPIRRIANQMAANLEVPAYDLYITSNKPKILTVENTDPPTVVIGSRLFEGAHDSEIQFMMGRVFWIIHRSMILPAQLPENEMEMLVASIVRQYLPDYRPASCDPSNLATLTKKVSRIIMNSKVELMPFVLECSGPLVNISDLGTAVRNSANRAGLLACGSVKGAMACLEKVHAQDARELQPSGEPTGVKTPKKIVDGNKELAALLQFAVSEDFFDVRQSMHIAKPAQDEILGPRS